VFLTSLLCAREADVRSRSQAFLHNKGSDRVRGPSLINDLAALITASDPSERRMKLFGIDWGRKRCQVVGFYNSAGAIQKRRYEACIEIRQARPKSARERTGCAYPSRGKTTLFLPRSEVDGFLLFRSISRNATWQTPMSCRMSIPRQEPIGADPGRLGAYSHSAMPTLPRQAIE
jgi:hypothetical protein